MDLIPLQWSAPKRVNTRFGERDLRVAPVTQQFWEMWKTSKDKLKEAGYSVAKNGGEWQVTHWAVLDPTEMAKKAETREQSRATDADITIPAPAGLNYYPHQKAGVEFIIQREATLLADDMGVGKTPTIIGVINMTKPKTVLIICPASLRLMWKETLEKWLTFPIKIDVLTSKSEFPENPGIVILNYDILRKFRAELRSVTWDLLAADESHALKNPSAQRTKEVTGAKATAKSEALSPIPAKRKVLATGTPLLNRPIELFSLLSYLDAKRWRSKHKFALRYCAAFHNGWGWDYSGASNLDELQDILRSSVMIRRTKAQVLTDLPPKTRQIITLPSDIAPEAVRRDREFLEKHEDKIMELIVAKRLAEASGDAEAYKEAVRQLKEYEALAFEEMAKAAHETALAKVPAVVDIVKDASGKVVLMAHHSDVIQALVEALGPHQTVKLTGQDTMEDRDAAVKRFQNDADCLYFVGSMKAAGVGLTLTASSHVVFAELDWVPGIVTQAEDRCHRIGQKSNVLVQHVVLDGSIDARRAKTLVAKQAVIDAALDNQSGTPKPEPEDTPTVQPYDWAEDWDQAEIKLRQAQLDRMNGKYTETVNRGLQNRSVPDVDLTPEQIEAVHEGCRMLAGWDADRALERNDVGYNKPDGRLGHALAKLPTLNKKQAQLGRVVLMKYRRQLGPIYWDIFPELKE